MDHKVTFDSKARKKTYGIKLSFNDKSKSLLDAIRM